MSEERKSRKMNTGLHITLSNNGEDYCFYIKNQNDVIKVTLLEINGSYVELGIKADRKYKIRRRKTIPENELNKLEKALKNGN